MDDVLQGLAIYVALLLAFRLAGKRRLADASVSDLLLFLVVGESIQQALAGRDFAVVLLAAVVVALLVLNRISDFVAGRSARERGGGGGPVLLVDHGEPLHDRMGQARVTPDDVVSRARESHGLESLDQIEYAVLEPSGHIAIVPRT